MGVGVDGVARIAPEEKTVTAARWGRGTNGKKESEAVEAKAKGGKRNDDAGSGALSNAWLAIASLPLLSSCGKNLVHWFNPFCFPAWSHSLSTRKKGVNDAVAIRCWGYCFSHISITSARVVSIGSPYNHITYSIHNSDDNDSDDEE